VEVEPGDGEAASCSRGREVAWRVPELWGCTPGIAWDDMTSVKGGASRRSSRGGDSRGGAARWPKGSVQMSPSLVWKERARDHRRRRTAREAWSWLARRKTRSEKRPCHDLDTAWKSTSRVMEQDLANHVLRQHAQAQGQRCLITAFTGTFRMTHGYV
jgi:hypothetical protein